MLSWSAVLLHMSLLVHHLETPPSHKCAAWLLALALFESSLAPYLKCLKSAESGISHRLLDVALYFRHAQKRPTKLLSVVSDPWPADVRRIKYLKIPAGMLACVLFRRPGFHPPVAELARHNSATKALSHSNSCDEFKWAEVKVVVASLVQTGIGAHIALECHRERLELTLYSHSESFIIPLELCGFFFLPC